MMPADDLAAIRSREAAATRGPWVPFDPDPLYPFPAAIEHQRSFRISTPDDEDPRSVGMKPEDMNIPIATADRESKGDTEAYANRDFICGARQDIPALLADHDALVAELARLSEGIEGLRVEHTSHTVCVDNGDGYVDEMEERCPAERGLVRGVCDCGAAEHNAKVDALLEGAPSIDFSQGERGKYAGRPVGWMPPEGAP